MEEETKTTTPISIHISSDLSLESECSPPDSYPKLLQTLCKKENPELKEEEKFPIAVSTNSSTSAGLLFLNNAKTFLFFSKFFTAAQIIKM